MTFDSVPIEEVRHFWDERPCNIRHSSAPIGSRRYSDEVARQKYAVEPHIPTFANFWAYAGKRVLEVGCGLGTETINFARGGADITAVDLSGESLGIAFQRLEVLGLRAGLVQCDAEHLSEFVTGPFDLVWSFGVIHHSPHPEKILIEMAKMTWPGAELKLMVYNRHSLKALRLMGGRWWRRDLIARQSEAQSGCPITYAYTRREITAMVEVAGFEVKTVRVDHVFPYKIGPYRDHRLEKHWYWRVMPRKMFRWLESHFGWHLLVTARRV